MVPRTDGHRTYSLVNMTSPIYGGYGMKRHGSSKVYCLYTKKKTLAVRRAEELDRLGPSLRYKYPEIAQRWAATKTLREVA